ncbi:MAG: YaiI/YqxD family protein [Acidobacteria bacterium]|nr:MAG: YaiI/YqxD family protein [Acidobacteriota bacterium]
MSAAQPSRRRVWVDADACPRPVREILRRAVERGRVSLVLVANRPLHGADRPHVTAIRVGDGFDAADRRIAGGCRQGDVAVTADIPLAAELVQRGVFVLTPRGEPITDANAGDRLALRDLHEELRASGAAVGGPPAYGPRDRRKFADRFDRLLTRLARDAEKAAARKRHPEPALRSPGRGPGGSPR